jgi:hypothetical protein
MGVGLLFGSDELVANWLFTCYLQKRGSYDRAVGLIRDGELVGAVLFQGWNGYNVEVSYYGKNTMTPGIIRCLAGYILQEFDPSRLTAMVPKRAKHWIRSLLKLGFKVEGIARCYYGKRDSNRNTAVRLVAFREAIERVAPPGTVLEEAK